MEGITFYWEYFVKIFFWLRRCLYTQPKILMIFIKSQDICFVPFSGDSAILSMAGSVGTVLPSLWGLRLWFIVSPALWVSTWLSCDLCFLSVADLNISQTAYPPLHDSNPHGPRLQTFIAEEKLNLQRVTRQDGETGNGAEENIVYL